MTHPTPPAPFRIGVWHLPEQRPHLNALFAQLPDYYSPEFIPADKGMSAARIQHRMRQVDLVWVASNLADLLEVEKQRPTLVRLRQSDLLDRRLAPMKWEAFEHIAFATPTTRKAFYTMFKGRISEYTTTSVVAPGIVMPDEAPPRGDVSPFDIAVLCHDGHAPNPSMLLELALALKSRNENYALHVFGKIENLGQAEYIFSALDHLGLTDDLLFYGDLPPEQQRVYTASCGTILSLDIQDRQPERVLEAMGYGVRPIVHGYPGVEDYIPAAYTFRTLYDAVMKMESADVEPDAHRQWVTDHFSIEKEAKAMKGVLDGIVQEAYTDRLSAHYHAARAATFTEGDTPVGEQLEQVYALVNTQQFAKARTALKTLPIARLSTDNQLTTRILAMQLALGTDDATDALYHADAALDLAPDEPLVQHLLGRALWAKGLHQAAAEAFVYSAERLDLHETTAAPLRLPLDPVQIYCFAGEACEALEQLDLAEQFYRSALRHDSNAEQAHEALSRLAHPLAA
ncbi:MAG: hypothetical protein RhofKO_07560 [Rhodothermales bacterium]